MKFEVRFVCEKEVFNEILGRFFLNINAFTFTHSAGCCAAAEAPGSSFVPAIAYSYMVSALRIPADLLMKLTSTSDLV